MVTSGFLAQAAKADLDGLRQKYPEAFARPIDKGSGQRFERVLAKGAK